jgi:predicted tellurium resistance membrane protein TerC
MSLDNVLAVAGAARGHYWVLVVGLVLSIALMGVAVSFVARILRKYPAISYAGLLIVVYVAVTMIIQGWHQVMQVI